MAQALPNRQGQLVLRTVDGEVIIYDELVGGSRPSTCVRAKILPDGELLVPRRRFARS